MIVLVSLLSTVILAVSEIGASLPVVIWSPEGRFSPDCVVVVRVIAIKVKIVKVTKFWTKVLPRDQPNRNCQGPVQKITPLQRC